MLGFQCSTGIGIHKQTEVKKKFKKRKNKIWMYEKIPNEHCLQTT